MTERENGITLIGMSGAGKTTTGPLLAETLAWPLSDVDSIIIEEQGKLIGEIVTESGEAHLLDLETKCVNKLDLYERVLVTPGSIAYDTGCHPHLKDQTTVVWLDVPLATLERRFGQDPKKHGAVVGAEGGFSALYHERRPLYAALADIAIQCDQKSPRTVARMILKEVLQHRS